MADNPIKVVYEHKIPENATLTTVTIGGTPTEHTHVWDKWVNWKDENSGCSGGSQACSICGMLQVEYDAWIREEGSNA